MTRHSIKELTATLDVSRGRVYQIINNLTGEQKIDKDANGNYILDDKAVHNIRSYFEANTNKDENKSTDEQVSKLTEQIDTLRKKTAEYERQIESLNQKIDLQKDLISTLKENNHTLTNQLTIKDEQIKTANQLTDQAQQLNAADKQKLDEPQKRKHFWQL